MKFDLPPEIEEQVREYAQERNMSMMDAVVQLVQIGLEELSAHTERNFIKEGRGMFKDPEDARMLDEAVTMAVEKRRRPST